MSEALADAIAHVATLPPHSRHEQFPVLASHMADITDGDARAAAVLEVLNVVIETFNASPDSRTQSNVVSWLVQFLKGLPDALDATAYLVLLYFANLLLTTTDGGPVIAIGIEFCSWLYVASMQLVSHSDAMDDMVQSLLTEAETMRQSILSMMAGQSTVPKLHSLKFVETVLLATTLPGAVTVVNCQTAASSPSTQRASLLPLSGDSPLTSDLIGTIADEMSDAIIGVMFDVSVSASILVAAVAAQVNLVRARPGLWEKTIPSLVLLEKAVRVPDVAPVSPAAHMASVTHMVRSGLTTVLRIVEASDYRQTVEEGLIAAGLEHIVKATKEAVAAAKPVPQQMDRKRRTIENQTTSIQVTSTSRSKRTKSTAVPQHHTHQTTLGPMTLPDITNAILLSLKCVPQDAPSFEQQHFEGLVASQLAAARRLQLLELERLRQHESRNVAEVRLGDLFGYVRSAIRERALARTTQHMSTAAGYSHMVRLAVSSMVDRYLMLRGDKEKQQASALIARCATSMVAPFCDAALDQVFDLLRRNFSDHLDLALHVLYAAYAALAPMPSSDGSYNLPFEINGSEELPVDVERPTQWLDKPPQAAPKKNNGLLNFRTDLPQKPTLCSVLTVRCLWVAVERCILKSSADLTDVATILRQCPCVSRYVWSFLHKYLCLAAATDVPEWDTEAAKKIRIAAGLRGLAVLALQRPATSPQALSLLLHYSTCPVNPTRFGAVKLLVRELLVPGLDSLVVKCALHSLHSIHLIRIAKTESSAVAMVKMEGNSMNQAHEAAQKASEQHVSRRLTLFFELNTRRPDLIRDLFDEFAKCVEVGNDVVQQILLGMSEVLRLVVGMSSNVALLNAIGDYPTGSERFVLHVIRALAEFLKKEVSALTKEDQGTQKARDLKMSEELLVHTCRQSYKRSRAASDGTHDVRLLIPIFCFLPKAELKSTYLPQVLQIGTNDVDTLRVAFRETLRSSGVQHDDKQKEAITPVELLVYLHEVSPKDMNLSAITTGIREALQLTRINSKSGAKEYLYNEVLIGTALKQVIKLPVLPTALMRTVLICVTKHPNLVPWLLENIMPDLIHRKVWATDKTLWKGVGKFIESYWPRTVQLLLSLPEDILSLELQQTPEMRMKLLALHTQGGVPQQYHALMQRIM